MFFVKFIDFLKYYNKKPLQKHFFMLYLQYMRVLSDFVAVTQIFCGVCRVIHNKEEFVNEKEDKHASF